MEQLISRMLEGYEDGRISRRELVAGLAVVAGTSSRAASAASVFNGVGLNHIALRVTEVPRSRDFYRNLLGLPVIRDGESSCFLGLGNEFLALFRNPKPGLDHYCIAVKSYEVGSAVEKLRKQRLEPRQPAGTDRVYFPDPDGIEVQLSAPGHRA